MMFQCHVCNKIYPKKGNLNRHLLEVHGLQVEQKKLFVCALCNERNSSEKCLFEHLQSAHEIHVKCEDISFSSVAEFEKWKDGIEQTTLSKFVKRHGSRLNLDDSLTTYYSCHRSGDFVSKGKNVRCVKLQGSHKIDSRCPAKIRVDVEKDGTCCVKYVSTHVGHKLELSHLQLTKKTSFDSSASLSERKRKLIAEFSNILCEMNTNELKMARKMVLSLKATVAVGRVPQKKLPVQKDRQKQRILPQRRLYSAKKRNRSNNASLVVPTAEQSNFIKQSLLADNGKGRVEKGATTTNQAMTRQAEVVTLPCLAAAQVVQHSPWNSVAVMVQRPLKPVEAVSGPSLVAMRVLQNSQRNGVAAMVQRPLKPAETVSGPSLVATHVLQSSR